MLPIITKTKPRKPRNPTGEAILELAFGALIGLVIALTIFGYVACDDKETPKACMVRWLAH